MSYSSQLFLRMCTWWGAVLDHEMRVTPRGQQSQQNGRHLGPLTSPACPV